MVRRRPLHLARLLEEFGGWFNSVAAARERPLRVHTYLRIEHDLAFQHPSHPFISFVYFVTSCGAMAGSYYHTWGSRLRHREDSIVLGPGSIESDVAKDIKEVWDASTDFTVENPSKRKATSPAGPIPPPGYKPPQKAPEASGDSSKGTNNSTSTK
jgi:hypothetical protein